MQGHKAVSTNVIVELLGQLTEDCLFLDVYGDRYNACNTLRVVLGQVEKKRSFTITSFLMHLEHYVLPNTCG